jgi:hypothetical protein
LRSGERGQAGFLTVTKPNWSSADLRDKSLEESDNLDPDVLAKEIVEDLEAALE